MRPDPGGEYQYKTNDLFVGYLDPALGHIPQADLHQDALVRILDWMASLSRPLPRLWHFPDGSPALAMFTGDSDGMSMDDFANTIATADRFGIPYTTYLKIEHHADVTPELQTALEARGHDFGEHPYAGAQPSLEEMRKGLRDELGAFRKRYGRGPVTNRSHSVIWVGWTESAKYLRENGVRLDTNFTAGRFHRGAYLNGSGLPVKLMDEDGELLDIYEQCTTLSDDGYVGVKVLAPALTIDECIAFTRERLDDAAERFHSVYNPCFHPLRTRPGAESNQRWYEAAIQACIDRGFQFTSARDWLYFNDGRRSLRMTEYAFDQDSQTLRLGLESEMDVRGLALALPYTFRGSPMSSASVDGEAVDTSPLDSAKGRLQALLPAAYEAGRHAALAYSLESRLARDAIGGLTWTADLTQAGSSRLQPPRGRPATRWGTSCTNGKMWILGGFIPQRVNDVWASSDGKTWTEATPEAPLGCPQPAELRGVRRQDVDHGRRQLRRQSDRQRPDRIQRRVELDGRRELGACDRQCCVEPEERRHRHRIRRPDVDHGRYGLGQRPEAEPRRVVLRQRAGLAPGDRLRPLVRPVDADYGGVRRQDVGDRRRRLRRDGVRELTDKLPGRVVLHRRR